MKESQARPETLLPAEFWCTKEMTSKELNDGEYEIIIPLVYFIDALKTPAPFYKFKIRGLRWKNNTSEETAKS